MTPDCELLRRYAEEADDAAFTELVRRHLNLVYASAVRLLNGNATMAQDVTQIVFTDLARKAGGLTQHTSVAGWLHTSVRFASANAVRGEQRRRLREQEACAMSDQTNVLETAWSQMRPLIDEAVGQLHEPERNAVLLRFFEEKSHREVGAALGLTENAARMRVERGLGKLRTHLARQGITASVVLLAATLSTHAASTPAPATLLAATVSSKAVLGAGLPAKGASVAKVGLHLFWGTKAQLVLAGTAAALSLAATALVVAHTGSHALSSKYALASPVRSSGVAPADVFGEMQAKMAHTPDLLEASSKAMAVSTTLAKTAPTIAAHALQSSPPTPKPVAIQGSVEVELSGDAPDSGNAAPVADPTPAAPTIEPNLNPSPPPVVVITPPAPIVIPPPGAVSRARIEKMAQWSPRLGGNGHYYLAVAEPGGVTWAAAQAFAAQRGGHLATITSKEENDFVFNLVNAPQFWQLSANQTALLGPWLGGIHSGTATDMSYGWHWVNNGGTIAFASWAAQAPAQQGNSLHFFAWGNNRTPTWDNAPAQSLMPGFVVEFEARPQPLLAVAGPNAQSSSGPNLPPGPQGHPQSNVPRGTLPVVIGTQHQPAPPSPGSLPEPRTGSFPRNGNQPLAMALPVNPVSR